MKHVGIKTSAQRMLFSKIYKKYSNVLKNWEKTVFCRLTGYVEFYKIQIFYSSLIYSIKYYLTFSNVSLFFHFLLRSILKLNVRFSYCVRFFVLAYCIYFSLDNFYFTKYGLKHQSIEIWVGIRFMYSFFLFIYIINFEPLKHKPYKPPLKSTKKISERF